MLGPMLRRVVALGIAAACLSIAAPAGADTNLGTDGAYTYMYDTVTIGMGVNASLHTGCPPGTYLVGGGADDDRFTPNSNLQSSFPVDSDDAGKAPDGWRMRSHNGLASNASPEVFAICQAAKPTYAAKRASVAADSGRKVKVACPASSHVVSGGLRAKGPTPDVALNSLAPFDGPDGNSAPGDGWRTKLANSGTNGHKLKLFAICQDEKPSYKFTDPPTIGNPGTHSISAPCFQPVDAIVGGGLWLSGPATAAQLHESAPVDDGDPGSVPSDDWRGEYGNPSATVNQTFYVICA